MGRYDPDKGAPVSGFKLLWANGFGGMGKSWYLHRVRYSAEAQHPEVCSLIIDWDKPEWRTPLTGEPRSDTDLFDVIATRLCQRLGPDAADAYWQAKDRVHAAQKEHRQEMDGFGNAYFLASSEDAPRLEPHFQQILIEHKLWDDNRDKRAKRLDAVQKDPKLYRELFAAWCQAKGHTELPVACPGRARANGLRDALRSAMKTRPLILLLDTCELLPPDLDAWLRELLAPLLREPFPLLVLVGSRLRMDLHQPRGVQKGWRDEVPGVHVYPVDFSEGSRFTVTEIEGAIEQLVRPYSGDVQALAGTLHHVTLGIPLAVRALLDMHERGDEVLEDLPGSSDSDRPLSEREQVQQVIDVVAQRFLLNLVDHAEREDDLRDIIALTLLPGYHHTTLNAFWDGAAAQRIRELSGRYSLLSDGDLHPSVRSFLRRHWRKAEQPAAFGEVLVKLQRHASDAGAEGAYATPTERLVALANELNLRSWTESDNAVDDIARAICLARTYEVDGRSLELLLRELPLAGALHAAGRKLWHRDEEERPGDAELVPWLKVACARSTGWSEEELACLALLEGLSTSTRPNPPEKALAALQALEQATLHFGIEALPRAPEVGDAYFDCGWCLDPAVAGSAWPTQAVLGYERAIALHTGESVARNNAANIYMEPLGQLQKAEEEYRAAIALDPKFAYPHNGLGTLYQAYLAQPQKAEEEYRAAIALDPKFASPHNGLGDLYQHHLAQPQKAEEEYRAVIALDPKFAYPHNGLGDLYQYYLAHPQKAEEEYRAAIALDPKFAYPHNGLGNLYQYYLAQPQKAEEEYHAAIALDPKFAYPHNGLGRLYEEAGRWHEADSAFRRALDLDATDGASHRGLAWIALRSTGNVAEAKRWAAEAKEIDATHPGTPLVLIAIDGWAGDWSKVPGDFQTWLSSLSPKHKYFPSISRFAKLARMGNLLP
jgi:tetratricopeptide (TPR) repeat protein